MKSVLRIIIVVVVGFSGPFTSKSGTDASLQLNAECEGATEYVSEVRALYDAMRVGNEAFWDDELSSWT